MERIRPFVGGEEGVGEAAGEESLGESGDACEGRTSRWAS
jgi:hypothetical protein